MTPAEIRRIQRAETLEELHEWADDLLAQARRRRARHAPSRKAKEEKRQARNERMASIRDEVFERAEGRCELCGDEATDAHHVLGGADRRESESEFSLAAICETCHGSCNASPAWARCRGLAWAERQAANELLASARELEAERTAAAEHHLVRARSFLATAERLEARMALAAAQARPLPTTTQEVPRG